MGNSGNGDPDEEDEGGQPPAELQKTLDSWREVAARVDVSLQVGSVRHDTCFLGFVRARSRAVCSA